MDAGGVETGAGGVGRGGRVAGVWGPEPRIRRKRGGGGGGEQQRESVADLRCLRDHET